MADGTRQNSAVNEGKMNSGEQQG